MAAGLKVADEVWIATALLHRENPTADDFTVLEIVDRAVKENITGKLRRGSLMAHANTHCVANRNPDPAQLRMLFETKKPNRRRLFREGDKTDPKRHGKTAPKPDEIPEKYRNLLDWYETEYAPTQQRWLQSAFDLIGVGKETFRGVDIDEYVRSLREGWN